MENLNVNQLFKSIIDADKEPVVICGLDNTIIYMNLSAIKRYKKYGGSDLIGRSIYNCHHSESNDKIEKCLEWFEESTDNNSVFIHNITKDGEDSDVYVVALRDDLGRLMGYYEKHESRLHETAPAYKINMAVEEI